MNAFENWFCGSPLWRYVTQRKLLPWIIEGANLGEHVLELGAGPGAATQELRQRVARVTSLEYDHEFAAGLNARCGSNGGGSGIEVVQGDAAALPFADGTFTSAIAVLMLHHLRSNELQDRAFAESFECCGRVECFWHSKFRMAGCIAPGTCAVPSFRFTQLRCLQGWKLRDFRA
jgi:SAM-dependent methyltransferase